MTQTSGISVLLMKLGNPNILKFLIMTWRHEKHTRFIVCNSQSREVKLRALRMEYLL